MNSVTRPPIEANGVGHGGDELDEALSAFFRSEMPHPWPRLQLPARPAPASPRRPWFRSPRLALAASVALLIAGSAALSAALTPPQPPDKVKLDEAGRKGIEREMRPPAEDDGDVGMKIESLDQIGNGPTTINIQVFKNK